MKIVMVFLNFRLLQSCRLDLCTSGMLRSVDWHLPTFLGLLDHPRRDRHFVPKRRYVTANPRCITSQKSEDPIVNFLCT